MRVWDQWEESSKRQVLGSWKTCTRKISVSNVEPREACHCLIWAIGTADIYLTLKRDTEAENHQSVEKQVLQVCSQCVFESEASVVVWEAVWHAVFLIFGVQVWLHSFVSIQRVGPETGTKRLGSEVGGMVVSRSMQEVGEEIEMDGLGREESGMVLGRSMQRVGVEVI